MLSEPQWEPLKQHLRLMQIIVLAMAAGVLTFIGIMPFLAAGRGGGPLPLGLSYADVGMAIAALAVAAWLVVPSLIANSMRQAIADGKPLTYRSTRPVAPEIGDVEPLINMYRTRLIVGGAFLEGAAFFNAIAYMLDGSPRSLGVAVLLVEQNVNEALRLAPTVYVMQEGRMVFQGPSADRERVIRHLWGLRHTVQPDEEHAEQPHASDGAP